MIADIRADTRTVKERGEAQLPRYQNASMHSCKKRLEATPCLLMVRTLGCRLLDKIVQVHNLRFGGPSLFG
jgi:hypothetical protein